MQSNQIFLKAPGSHGPVARHVDGEENWLGATSKDIPSKNPPVTDVVVLCWTGPGESDSRAQKIAEFMGATVRLLTLTPSVFKGNASTGFVPKCSCLVVEADTLANIAAAIPAGPDGLGGLLESANHVFVYGFKANKAHDAVLQALSSNRLASIRSVSDTSAKLKVAADQPGWCFQFSGLAVGLADPTKENSFVEGNGRDEFGTLIRIGDEPFLVRGNHVRGNDGGSRIFLFAGRELADIGQKVTRHCSVLKWFCGLVPLMMFLRGALQERVWHNDHPRACFIIDDPLLKSRHGFLQYKHLVESIRRQQFSACIAFIPWNYRRSSRSVAELFLANPGRAFLCVHGCDHTGAEFEARDTGLVRGKAQLALDRMRKHEELSGVGFDKIMVFPQGLFSPEALAALKEAGYLAAVNTELSPSAPSGDLTIRDLLDVAVTRYSDFPLFGRHYPNDLAEFAFDLFLGKPILTAEHHSYFKDGYEALETFIQQLKALDSRIEWVGLDSLCSHACLTKVSDGGALQVRFYTSRFHLMNTSEQNRRYILQHRRAPGTPLPQATVDGCPWLCQQEGDDLTMCLSLKPGQTANIEIASEPLRSRVALWKPTKSQAARIWLRRVLCEVRDNYVDRGRALFPPRKLAS